MTSTEKTQTAARDTIPLHLLNRIESEWNQMRAATVASPRPVVRPASDARD